MKIDFVIPCLLGMEGLISRELKEMDAENVAAENGRVLFSGDEYLLARVNIRSRYAERVQILVGEFEARSFEELFEGTKALEWEKWIGETDAFPVKGYSINSALFSTRDCQAIIKKAVAERLKTKYHKEWFEETGPVHQMQFAINKDKVSLLIDTSGPGLHKRGYRTDANDAPIKETLAAALCSISFLKPYHKLYDPLCGSGTILIEGALMAKNIAPGINRNFSAERFDVIPREVWSAEREAARSLERECNDFRAFGSDIDGRAIEIAAANASRAGVADLVMLARADVRSFRPSTERGTLITNPPYGERMMSLEECENLYRDMGRVFERRQGWSYTIISPDEEFETAFGRKADKRRKLYNGMIKCQAYMYFK